MSLGGVAEWGMWGPTSWTQGRRKKNFQRGSMQKNSKKDRKTALSSLFRGERGQQKKDRKIAKKHQKIALSSLFTIFVPCIKIQEATATLPAP